MKRKNWRIIGSLIFVLFVVSGAGMATRAAASSTGNLISDSGFETGLAGFTGSYGETLTRSTETPLSGAASVVVNSSKWGSNVVWQKELSSAFASTYSNKGNSFTVSAKIKPDFVASGVTFEICASVYYFIGNAKECQPVILAPGTTVNPIVTLTLDPTKPVATLFFRLKHSNGSPIQYNLDDVSADFNYVTAETATSAIGSGTTSGTTSGSTYDTTSGTTDTSSGTTGSTNGSTGSTSGTTSGSTNTTSGTTSVPTSTTSGTTVVTSPETTVGSTSTPNLLADPNFESGVSNFYPQSVRDSVVQTQTNPIQGEGSLAVISSRWGSTAIWQQQITSAFASQYGARGTNFAFNGKIKITNIGAGVKLNACVGVSYFTGTDEKCVAVPTTKNVISNISISLPLDNNNSIGHLFIRLKHSDGPPIQYLVDQASAVFTYTPGTTSGSTDGSTGSTSGSTGTTSSSTGTTSGTTSGGTTTGGTTAGSTGTGPTTVTMSGLGFTPRPAPVSCPAGTNRTFNVGTGQTYASLGAVPWGTLTAGDTVRVHYRSTPYKEKILISGRGTAANPITVCGVADSTTGALPVIDGNNATTAASIPWYYTGTQTRGLVIVAMRDGDLYGTKPEHVIIKGLEIRGAYYQYQYTNSAGTRQNYPGLAAGVFVERGENITIQGNIITDSGNGLFVASGGDEAMLSRNIIIDGNYIYGNGTPTDPAAGLDNFHRHNLYTEADRVTMQNNFFGPQRDGAAGNNIKDRSAGTVIRNNFIMGGAHLLDLVDPEDAYQLLTPLPYYRQTYVYENIFINRNTDAGNMVHYGGDLGLPGNTRQGTLYFYNNTVVIQQNQDRHWETSLLQLETAAETADLRNNVIYKEGTAILNILNNNVGHANFGRNWITSGYVAGGNITGLENLIVGANPGFTNLATYDLRPTGSSPLVDVGGPLHPSVPMQYQALYEYRNGASPALRPLNGTTWDLGALEAN